MSNLQDDIFDFVSLWKQSYSQKVPEIYNHSFSCSPFRERLTSSLSSLLRYARKDSKKRSSFTTSSPKREAVVKALPNLSRKKTNLLISFDNSSGYGFPLGNLQIVPDDWNSLIAISAQQS